MYHRQYRRPLIWIAAVFTVFFVAWSTRSAAQSSPGFTIVGGTINTGGGLSSSASFRLNSCLSPDPIASGVSSSASFRMQAGCLDIRLAEPCGNGQLDAGEACDDGNRLDGDCCSSDCQVASPIGTACGDPSDTDCTDPDTCDASGNCLANDASAGTAAPTQCSDANDCTLDECDGAGGCQNPNMAVGSACGDPTDDDCTDPDTCDGAGLCQPNDAAAGAPAPALCDDSLECTADECNGAGGCQYIPVGAGTPASLQCGDGNDCTNDECDGAGGCQNPALPVGTLCGDPSNSECTNPDTCDGAGLCQGNDEPAGTTCGDPTDTDCLNPDSCDGTGACASNDPPDGTACDDGLACTTPDECSAGTCVGTDVICPDDGNPCTVDKCVEPSGQCVNPPEPGTTCTGRSSGALANVSIIDKDVTDTGDKRDKLKWKWFKGEIALAEFGDPVNATSYDVCIFDSTGGQYSAVTHLAIPPGPSWQPAGKYGWKYRDRSCQEDGVCTVRLKSDRKPGDGRGQAKVTLSTKGPGMPMPGAATATKYMNLDSEVVLQVSNSEGYCWSIGWKDGQDPIFKNEVKNDTGKFKSKRRFLVP